MRLFSSLISLLLILLLPLLLFSLVTGLILLAAIGFGQLLTRFLPLTLFEGAALSLVAGGIGGVITYRLLKSRPPEEEDEWAEAGVPDPIPTARFVAKGQDLTNMGVIEYLLANAIYMDLWAEPGLSGKRSDGEWRELAIQMAHAAAAILILKPAHTRQVRIAAEAFRRQLADQGVSAEEEVFAAALRAVQETVKLHNDDLVEVIQERAWAAKAAILLPELR